MGKRNYIDLTGQMFNRWKVIKLDEPKNGKRYWICECQCEKHTIKSVYECDLKNGRNMSCGCIQRERTKKALTKHGQTGSRLYGVWQNMKRRCYDEKNQYYYIYGGKGVTVCEEWKNDFSSFSKWAYENGYDPEAKYGECTIDRIDVDGNYCPENCRWADEIIQANNKTDNHLIEYKGETKTIAEWCRELNLPYERTMMRINRGWEIDDVFEVPEREKRHFEYLGRDWSIKELSEYSGIPSRLLRSRLCRDNMSVEEAISMTKNNTSIKVGKGVKTECGQYILIYNGLQGNSSYWEDVTGIKKATIRSRAKRGLDVEQCLKEYIDKETT